MQSRSKSEYGGNKSTIKTSFNIQKKSGICWYLLKFISCLLLLGQTSISSSCWSSSIDNSNYWAQTSFPNPSWHIVWSGNSAHLTLEIKSVNEYPSALENWLQFNATHQILYGYPLELDFQYSPQDLFFVPQILGARLFRCFWPLHWGRPEVLLATVKHSAHTHTQN